MGTFLVRALQAQDALRISEAGEEAAEARVKANEAIDYYNFRMGDLRLRMGSELLVVGDDNVNLVGSDPQADVTFQPSVSTQLIYPISGANSLNLNLAAGYSAYVREQNLDQFFITPGTELGFDIYIKDFVIRLHDWFSITEQSYEDPSAADVANYSYLENTAGLAATWDLNKAHLTVGYDHLIRLSLNSIDQQENSSQDLFTVRSGWELNSYSEFGAEASAGLISYDQATLNGGVQYSAGLYYRLRLSRNFNLRADAGYLINNLDNAAAATTNYQQNVNAFYGSLSLEHQVNQQLAYNLQIGRGVNAGLFSDTLDLYYARLQTDISVIRKWRLKLLLSYENGAETGGLGENFERYGFGVGVAHALTDKLLVSLDYFFWDRFSNQADRTYIDNQLMLKITYRF